MCCQSSSEWRFLTEAELARPWPERPARGLAAPERSEQEQEATFLVASGSSSQDTLVTW